MRLPIVINSNLDKLTPSLIVFLDMVTYWLKIAKFLHLTSALL